MEFVANFGTIEVRVEIPEGTRADEGVFALKRDTPEDGVALIIIALYALNQCTGIIKCLVWCLCIRVCNVLIRLDGEECFRVLWPNLAEMQTAGGENRKVSERGINAHEIASCTVFL